MKFKYREYCTVCGKSSDSQPADTTEEGFAALVAANPGCDYATERSSGEKLLYRALTGECPVCAARAAEQVKKAAAAEAAAAAKIARSVFVFEHECGGRDAAGGGCGAHLGFEDVSYSEFNTLKGATYDDSDAVGVSEMPTHMQKAHEYGELHVKMKFRPCAGCRVL